MKDFLKTADLTRRDLRLLLDMADRFKSQPYQHRTELQNESVSLYFNKPSTRTRISMETAVVRLGGVPIMMGPNDLQLGRGETIEDTARVISRFSRAFIIRTFSDEEVHTFARWASIPVVNALTDRHHPCQSVADLMTLREKKGDLDRLKLAYLGDGNNVAGSLMEACAISGCDIAIASPPGYGIDEGEVERIQELAEESGCTLMVTEDPKEAAGGADALYTDVWLSMGDPEEERQARLQALGPYQVNEELFSGAKPDAIFMHCLPDHRGEEVSAEVVDGPRSVVFDQAENRLHTAMSIIYGLVEQRLEGRGGAR
ncbi:MAG TPA: ornithine carbamoyltransferase [Acidobacteriota bacterium]|nr:ornithine carbamoyltransferase [Acidobacteriota bacterium]